MQLSDKDILKEIDEGGLVIATRYAIYPFQKSQIQPASLDMRLGNKITCFDRKVTSIDTKDISKVTEYQKTKIYDEGSDIVLRPHEIIFSETYENIQLSSDFSARIFGRNRYARMGISVHCACGYINPGFSGPVPLQIINNNPFSICIHPFEPICQLVLYRLSGDPNNSYADRKNPSWRESTNENYPQVDVSEVGIEKAKETLTENYYININKNVNSKEANYHMEDVYNVQQAGIVGKKAGKKASVNVTMGEGGHDAFDLQQVQNELVRIKKYIRENFSDLDYDILFGKLSYAEKKCAEKDVISVKDYLKKGGKILYDIAKTVGCSVIANYLSGQLGL